MELFDEETYEKLEQEYLKELSTPTSGFKRAMLGAPPFVLQDSENKKDGRKLLSHAFSINHELLDRCESYGGEVARVVRELLAKNEETLKKLDIESDSGCKIDEKDFFITAIEGLCKTLESAVALYPIPEVQVLLSRSYTAYAFIILG